MSLSLALAFNLRSDRTDADLRETGKHISTLFRVKSLILQHVSRVILDLLRNSHVVSTRI